MPGKTVQYALASAALAGTGLAIAAIAPATAASAAPAASTGLPLSALLVRSEPTAAPAARPAAVPATAPAARPAAAHADGAALTRELVPVGTSGPQAWMPISRNQLANATTIVRQALHHGMGLRSAVIAIATSMQEARLVNIDYGTSDSLGLFQQQPDCGWGTARQVMNPAYAADAFLAALHRHQATDPGWKSQPLWSNAQAVQNSAFPFAYAKWETQAAHLVRQIAG